MACNNCGNTTSSPCACQDHGLTTPCSYSNCNGGTPCEIVICSECIVDCTTVVPTHDVVWDAETSTATTSTPGLRMSQGDSVSEMLQRTALFAADPGGSTAANIAIAPLRINAVLANQVELKWSGVDPTVTSIEVYKAPVASTSWTLVDTVINGAKSRSTEVSKTILGLVTNTAYKFKLISTDGKNSANSVAVFAKTLQ